MISDSEQTCFCLSEIRDSQTVINRISEQLPKIRASYDKYKGTKLKREYDSLLELQKAVKRLWNEFPGLIQRLSEYGDSDLAETAKKLFALLKKFDYLGVKDYTKLCSALNTFSNSLPVQENKINTAALGHLMNRVKMGYFPTDTYHVDLLRRAVIFPDEKVNLLDPCCGEGLALAHFSQNTNSRTYGIEIDEERGAEAQSRIFRVGFGSFFHSRISLNSFGCLFLNPPYLAAPSQHGTKRLEKSFLADSIRLLVNGGLLIYIIPYYRATPDVCRVLCENFENLRVYRFIGKEFERFKQVVFLGTRVPRQEADSRSVKLSEYMLTPDNIPPITDLPEGIYTIPSEEKPIELFKGAVFNIRELADQLKKSNSVDCLFDETTLDNRERKPLLPLNLSQIGLVGASGLMNGLVKCDNPHIIKGRVVKEKKTKIGAENQYGKTEVREITSNRLIFNVLAADGFHSLG